MFVPPPAGAASPVPPPADVGSPMPPLEGVDPLREDVDLDYPGEKEPQKFYNHGRKILALEQPHEAWFQDVLTASGLKDLCEIGYTVIHNRMLMEFAERWHPKTSFFHLPHGEVTITLDDVSCLLHILIRGALLRHGRMRKEEARNLLVEELVPDPLDAVEDVDKTHGAHVRYSFLVQRYTDALVAARYADGDLAEVEIHRQHGWILQHFQMIIGWGSMQEYIEVWPRARAFIPLRGIQTVEPYRVYLDHIVAEDTRYDAYATHCETRLFDDIALFSGWLACSSTITVPYLPEHVIRQFSYCQTIPRHPFVSVRLGLTRRQIDDIFADYQNHMVPDEARATRIERD
ncbi:uncharacterized protein LOC131658324 [Vicia villosa]|uniref:uncharacterized protein LOC131658324 n=1 Tax=Vicia villosa TaxID=3911 RepID=UPI00273A906E|nr:uncharacterized protein LOC131658324 [Vicia villosa]